MEQFFAIDQAELHQLPFLAAPLLIQSNHTQS